jgi:hypothetical protein
VVAASLVSAASLIERSAMPPRESEFDQEMVKLEAEIKRLEAEYNMFFAGRLPRLPWETRARVEALVKRYDRMSLRNTAEKFRFNTLQSKFQAFVDLWERHLKAKEEGRPVRGRRAGGSRGGRRWRDAAEPSRSAPQHEAALPTGPRVVAVTTLKDPLSEAERLQALYDKLSAARKEAGEKPVPFEAFKQVVRAQVTKLGSGTGEVAFRIAVQDGKVTLTAKAMKGSE